MVREIFPPHAPYSYMRLDPIRRELQDYSIPCGKNSLEKP